MKKIASLTVLLALVAGSAFAAGINLSWDVCGSGGTQDKAIACGTVVTPQRLVGSFTVNTALDPTGTDNIIDIVVAGATMPAFWAIGNSQTTLAPRFTLNQGATSGTCANWMIDALDQASSRTQSGNRIRLRVVPFIGSPGATLNPGTESVSFLLDLNTSDGTAVNGCQDGACFLFSECAVDDAFNGGREVINAPLTRNWVTWQGGGGISCPAATPTKKSTWGAIKAIYR